MATENVKLPSLRIFKGGIDRVFPTDAEGSSLCYRMADLRSRWFMNHLSEHLYNEGNKEGAGILMHAELYLIDRLAYALFPDGVIADHWRRVNEAVAAELRSE